MKYILIAAILFFAPRAIAQPQETLNLMPVPAHLQLNPGKFRITRNFAVLVKSAPADSVLCGAVNRAYQALNRKTGALFVQQYIKLNDTITNASMQVMARVKVNISPDADESYNLNIGQNHIDLTAENTIGILRGLQTLVQLCAKDNEGYYLPCVAITDIPRFRWRGLMIDVARHFITADEIKRNIDAMATVKMNVLHWHLTDDEGFRVESKLFPLLQQDGSNGDYYTQAQLRDIVKYAADRGIMIVPEFDMPGHSQSWFAGYPQMASQPGPYRPGPRMQWQNEHPDPNRPKGNGITDMIANLEAPTFDATSERVYTFLDKFFGEMAGIFPSAYVHIGADENNGLAWKLNPKIAAWMQARHMDNPGDLQRYFVGRVHDLLQKRHRQVIGWEEIYNDKLPKDAIVHKWIPASMGGFVKSMGAAAEFASQGYKTIISEGFYLDVFMPAYIHYTNPAVNGSGSPNILGGEAAQWTELADNGNIAGRIWPRAGAIAERLWSPAGVTDVADMYRRLAALNYQLDEQGLTHLGNYERALRRLAADKADNLKILTDVLTPVKGYGKMIAGLMKGPSASYQTAPLTSVSDIVFVDSETKRKFRTSVVTYLASHDKEAENQIKNYLATWQKNDAILRPLFVGDKRLSDIQDQSQNLSAAAAIGLEALDRADKQAPTEAAWIEKQRDQLRTYARAHHETEIAVIPEILALVSGQLTAEPETYPVF